VLSEAGGAGVRRVVTASSINAFGVPMNHHDVQPAYYPLDEQSPVEHDDAYSLSKWVDEQTARMAHSRWGVDVLAVRFPLVRDGDALRRWSAQVVDDPDLGRLAREGWAYLDLRDACTLLEAGLTQPLSGAHVVLATAADILPDRPTEELLDRFARDVPRRRAFPGRTGLVSLERVRQLLGWQPAHSVHSRVRAGADAVAVTA
jgi:nucleoside-diphosphate-sugar epimerase